MRARIGIVSWNTAELLDVCLKSLPAALAGVDAEIVVVDNDSSDGSADVARRHARVEVIRNPTNVGYAAAMNQALRGVDSGFGPDALVALNPDTVVPPEGLTRLLETLEAHPSVGLVVPKLVNPDGTTQHSVYRFPSVALSAVGGIVPVGLQRARLADSWWLEVGANHDHASDIDWAIGAVHVLRASAVDLDAPYNERWFMYVEDLDLCWQLNREGWRRRLEPSVAVVHVGNASGSQAWGGGRTAKWLLATYDWYRMRRGEAATRLWAAANIVGVLTRLGGAVFRVALSRPIEPWRRDLGQVLSLHLRVLLLGVPDVAARKSRESGSKGWARRSTRRTGSDRIESDLQRGHRPNNR